MALPHQSVSEVELLARCQLAGLESFVDSKIKQLARRGKSTTKKDVEKFGQDCLLVIGMVRSNLDRAREIRSKD